MCRHPRHATLPIHRLGRHVTHSVSDIPSLRGSASEKMSGTGTDRSPLATANCTPDNPFFQNGLIPITVRAYHLPKRSDCRCDPGFPDRNVNKSGNQMALNSLGREPELIRTHARSRYDCPLILLKSWKRYGGFCRNTIRIVPGVPIMAPAVRGGCASRHLEPRRRWHRRESCCHCSCDPGHLPSPPSQVPLVPAGRTGDCR